MARDIITAEYYSSREPDKLLAAADLPKKRAQDAAELVGKALCRAVGADSVNAILIDENGNAMERLLICRK